METLTITKPKLGFAGVGWIGKDRLQAIVDQGMAEVTEATDPDAAAIEELQREVQDVSISESFEAMVNSDLDGIVIATPSALHASQARLALESGKAVFCQKPLGRSEKEAAEVVETARRNDLLLGVDFSYRYTEAVRQVKKVIESGEIGRIYGAHLTFHNAYGPDKSWYRQVSKAGGGCLMDLGIHLVDLLYWVLDAPEVTSVQGKLFNGGRPLEDLSRVEDYAAAQLELDNDIAVQLSCSWNLPAGKDAQIEAVFYGAKGGVAFKNVGGSFYDFQAERYLGTDTEVLAGPPDDWGGRAAADWAQKLAEGKSYDPAAETYVKGAHTLDEIYQQSL